MRRFATVVLVGVLGAALAACIPTFPAEGAATAVVVDGIPVLRWTPATITGEGEAVGGYRVQIDGVEVASIPAPTTACTLLNLSAGTSHAIRVTAFSAKNAGSQGLANGNLLTEFTPAASYGPGGAPTCSATADADLDALPDGIETGTGTFVSVTDTGTSPADDDTDADGIGDGVEVAGTPGGLDLRAIGTSPTHKDLLFEVDWFDDGLDCGAHSHRPTTAAVNRLTAAFAAAPVANPDGTTGVNVIVDRGQGGGLTGGNLIADADGVLSSGVNSAEFLALKGANFAADRQGIFHYVLAVHRYNGTSSSSGQAEIDGDDLIVSLQCFQSTVNVANTIMHEVGHNLGLRHGGQFDLPNYKPNYNSVMNYRYQFPGVDTDCDIDGDGVLAYSPGTRVAVNENAIEESLGVCGTPADLDGDATIDAVPYGLDLTQDGLLTTLVDWNDWAAMDLGAIVDGDGASPNGEHDHPEVITEQPVPGS